MGPASKEDLSGDLKRNASVLLFVSVLVLSLSMLNVYFARTKPPKILTLDTTTNSIKYLEDIIRDNPTARDAYLKLAEIESARGNYQKASWLLSIAQEIDPFLEVTLDQTAVLGREDSPQ